MSPVLASSLKQLRSQIDAQWPGRSKASDGWIGDAAHQATKSDHNPDGRGVVWAIDVTDDPVRGPRGGTLAEKLRLSRDPRIKYVIWNRKMFSSYPAHGVDAWTWRPYSGANPHKHVHVSAQPGEALWDLDRPYP